MNVAMSFDYAAAGVPVREDLKETHRFVWDHVARPGTWWTGAERVTIAAETRRAESCALCRERKAALSPAGVPGAHDAASTLPAGAVEVVHRLRTDPARLSRTWFDALVPGRLEMPAYVETVGVSALVTGVDFFARSLGVPREPLPEPQPGTSSRRLPAGAQPGTAWVPMVAPEDATGPEADLYGEAPVIPNIVRALSLVPAEVRALRRCNDAHYVPLPRLSDPSARRALDRAQMELVAARVSALNECFY